jgi:demethylmenaquinone methyltransferase/2-methoxy-6-polyprenyl-1,4-benzoquinol methylase
VQALFNRIAPVYDQLNDWLSLGQHRVWKQMAVKWGKPFKGAIGLDVCCGSGDLARLMARQVGRTGHIFGLDFSTAQLAIAEQRNLLTALPITWVEGDALDLPFQDDFFDLATMGYGLRNVGNIAASLSEVHRVLKPGATAAILDFHRPTSSPLRIFQQWYLDNLVVPMAEHLGLKQEYAYISPSLDRFPLGKEQVELATQAGFAQVTHYPIAAGMMGVLVVRK